MADGTWDLDLVKKTAHYVTPSGAELWDKDKRDILQLGKWRPTKKCTDSTKRGYHINAFYMPWISFGDIAKAFLQHVARGKDSLRVFIYEWLAEEFWGELETVKSDVMSERQGEYEKGERMTESEGICNENGDTFKEFYVGRPSRVIVTVDVQKGYGWWLAREWVKGGDSGLIDYGKWMDWGELNDTATAAKASWVLVDCGYAERQQEVYEASLKYRFIPTKGQENIKDLLFLESAINPFEGKRRHRERHSLTVLFFKTDPFKMQLMQRIRAESGHAWYTYRDPEVDYQNQVTSEHREDGRWKIKPGHGTENHLWDCETLQLLGATRFGLNRFRGYENAEEGETVQSA